MTGIRGGAYIVGAYEHPERRITGSSVPQVLAEVTHGALADAGLGPADVDGWFGSSEQPGLGGLSMLEYLGLRGVRHVEDTESGGASYPTHVGHATAAIMTGRCEVAVIAMGGLPRSLPPHRAVSGPEDPFEAPYGIPPVALYALAAARHMHEYGTTPEQLAEVKVAASEHAKHNPNALLRDPVTVAEVLDSPLIADPLHRLDCCVTTDGGGAVVVVSPEVAARLDRHRVKVLGQAEAFKHAGPAVDVTCTGAVWSGPRAFAEAGLTPADVDYASIYDSFTITVLMLLEDLGFCAKGEGGRFVADGGLRAHAGKLAVNTDGGGLCNNHPGSRGGMVKIIEAVRQLRGEANAPVQLPDVQVALVQGIGKALGSRHFSSTLLLGQEDT
ncbi:thiolase domain-containing protein [Acrocarpospora sp. B8E8]|uniref:thiolase domain-containing protein n=1 Tax=Acrocarpospora sp. B8E8 TaxID=3153572 RepID=UPI00325E9009